MFVGLPQETTHLGQPTDRNSKLHINLIIYCDVDEETNWTPLPPPPTRNELNCLWRRINKYLHMTNQTLHIFWLILICTQNDDTWQNKKFVFIARIKVKFVEHYITHKWGNKCIIMPYQHVFLHHLKIVFVNYMKSFLVS